MDLQTSIYRYCNYQERCQQDVRDKLYSLGATTPEVENLIAGLIEANLLNEERFARSFVRGRFRIKHWGKIKIVQHLKQHHISEYCIKKGLSEIDGEEYYKVLKRLCAAKWSEVRTEKNVHIRKGKTFRFLQQRGFETSLITEVLTEIMAKE
jgi:regulatory protein